MKELRSQVAATIASAQPLRDERRQAKGLPAPATKQRHVLVAIDRDAIFEIGEYRSDQGVSYVPRSRSARATRSTATV